MSSLQNEVARVTGGSSGIGLAAVRELAEGGAKVFVTGRRPAEVEAAMAGAAATPGLARLVRAEHEDALYAQLAAEVLLGRVGEPEDRHD